MLGGGGKEKENYDRSFVPSLLKTRRNFPTPGCERRGRERRCCTALRPNFQPRGINYSDGCSPFGASNVLALAPRFGAKLEEGGNEREPFLPSSMVTKRFLAWPIYTRRIVHDQFTRPVDGILNLSPGFVLETRKQVGERQLSDIDPRPRIVEIECLGR